MAKRVGTDQNPEGVRFDKERAKTEEAAVITFGPRSERAKGPVEIPPGGSRDRTKDTRPNRDLRISLGKRWSEILTNIQDGEYTWAELAASLTPVELARGQLMDKNNNFTGRPPTMVPRAFYDACIKELLRRGSELYKENYVASIEAMTSIAQDTTAKAADRIKAATFVIERLEGKVPERLVVATTDTPWAGLVAGAIAEVAESTAVANVQEYHERRGLPALTAEPHREDG